MCFGPVLGYQYTNSSWCYKVDIWYSELMSRSWVVKTWSFDCYYLIIHSISTSKYLYNSVTVLQWPQNIFYIIWYTPWASVIHHNSEWVGIKYWFVLRPTRICMVCYCIFTLNTFQSFSLYFLIYFFLCALFYIWPFFSVLYCYHGTIVDI